MGAFRPHALFVPQESLFQGRTGRCVFVIQEDQTVKLREVRVGATFGNYAIIQSGLQKGELVVANGINKLLEGSKVHVVNTEMYEP